MYPLSSNVPAQGGQLREHLNRYTSLWILPILHGVILTILSAHNAYKLIFIAEEHRATLFLTHTRCLKKDEKHVHT